MMDKEQTPHTHTIGITHGCMDEGVTPRGAWRTLTHPSTDDRLLATFWGLLPNFQEGAFSALEVSELPVSCELAFRPFLFFPSFFLIPLPFSLLPPGQSCLVQFR